MQLQKRWLIGLMLILFCSACGQSDGGAIKKNDMPAEKAVELAARWDMTESMVLAGGIYKEGEYKRFTYKGMTYRYMAKDLDTKKKLRAELEKSVTRKVAKQFMKDHKFIKHNGNLAQIEADGGSLLVWKEARAKELKSRKKSSVFELSVPVGYTGKVDKFKVTFEYVNKSGWRISELPIYLK